MLIYDGRIFKINKNSNKYKAKEKRIIYFCQYYFKLLQKRKNEDLNPFCTMKITYYPDKEPDDQYKISGEHSAECLELYNENKPIKNKILSDWNNFKSKCTEEFNKCDKYLRKDLIEIARNIYNNKEYSFKYTDNKIKNMIADWKKTSQKFTKYLFLEDTKAYDNTELLQTHIYKRIVNKKNNRVLNFESFIWANDFFLNRIKESQYLFIDSTFHIPKGFYQFLIIMYYDEIIKRKIPAIYTIMNSKCENAYDIVFCNIKDMLNFINPNSECRFITVTTDNEKALINSLNKYFPKVARVSCFYDYKNVIQKKLNELGLKKNFILLNPKLF